MMSSSPPQDPLAELQAFRASMPPSYRRAHGLDAIQEHAAIVARRANAVAHVELWRVRRGGVIVAVMDDQTGGLAMMSAAIAAAGFDIVVAEAYRRARDSLPAESIGLFELRRPSSPEERITPEDIARIAEALLALVKGESVADRLLRRHAPTAPPGPQGASSASFADDDETAILLVEARDRPGLLATVTSTLRDAEVRVIDSEIVTVGGRVRDRFHLTESDGAALAPSRRREIAARVLGAIERSDP